MCHPLNKCRSGRPSAPPSLRHCIDRIYPAKSDLKDVKLPPTGEWSGSRGRIFKYWDILYIIYMLPNSSPAITVGLVAIYNNTAQLERGLRITKLYVCVILRSHWTHTVTSCAQKYFCHLITQIFNSAEEASIKSLGDTWHVVGLFHKILPRTNMLSVIA